MMLALPDVKSDPKYSFFREASRDSAVRAATGCGLVGFGCAAKSVAPLKEVTDGPSPSVAPSDISSCCSVCRREAPPADHVSEAGLRNCCTEISPVLERDSVGWSGAWGGDESAGVLATTVVDF